MNKVILMGRLTHDPEVRTTNNGTKVVIFSVAVNRRFKNADGDYDADFINCVAWRQSAEFISKYFSKGRMIAIVGTLQTRKWLDYDGNTRYATEVIVEEAHFCGDSKQSGSSGSTRNSAPPAPTAAADFQQVADDDDIPF